MSGRAWKSVDKFKNGANVTMSWEIMVLQGYLLKIYMVEGKEIFEGEDDKYIKFVAQIR